MKPWTQKQIRQHESAAKKLGIIKDEVKEFISKNKKKVYESEVSKFIKEAYKKHGLVNDSKKEFAIVAFGKNTKEVHHFPTKDCKLRTDTLILLDIWARLDQNNAPYADMTWMFWYGNKVQDEIQTCLKILFKSRDNTLKALTKFLKQNKMPRGLDLDRAAHDHIGNNGHCHAIKHTVGHSLGTKHPHGDLPGLNWKEHGRIIKNMGYTIEPGMYFKDFGLRSEIDFYINDNNETIVTTPIQKQIDII